MRAKTASLSWPLRKSVGFAASYILAPPRNPDDSLFSIWPVPEILSAGIPSSSRIALPPWTPPIHPPASSAGFGATATSTRSAPPASGIANLLFRVWRFHSDKWPGCSPVRSAILFNVAPGAISGNNTLIFKTSVDFECSEAVTQSIMQDAPLKAVCQEGRDELLGAVTHLPLLFLAWAGPLFPLLCVRR